MSNVVTNITSKSLTSKLGKAFTVWTVHVDDGKAYNYGFVKPKFNIGDTINFVAEEDTYGPKMDSKTVRVVSTGGGSSIPATPSSVTYTPRAYGKADRVFPIPPLHGDRSIVRQNALTNARELYTVFLHRLDIDSITIEDTARNVIHVARIFERFTAGDDEMEAALTTDKE